jgi:hypothetical protein
MVVVLKMAPYIRCSHRFWGNDRHTDLDMYTTKFYLSMGCEPRIHLVHLNLAIVAKILT